MTELGTAFPSRALARLFDSEGVPSVARGDMRVVRRLRTGEGVLCDGPKAEEGDRRSVALSLAKLYETFKLRISDKGSSIEAGKAPEVPKLVFMRCSESDVCDGCSAKGLGV